MSDISNECLQWLANQNYERMRNAQSARDSALATVATLSEELNEHKAKPNAVLARSVQRKLKIIELESTVAEMKEELAGVRDRLAEAVGLLRPFAESVGSMNEKMPDTVGTWYAGFWKDHEHRVTAGSFRRAAAFLAKNQPDHNPTEPGDAT